MPKWISLVAKCWLSVFNLRTHVCSSKLATFNRSLHTLLCSIGLRFTRITNSAYVVMTTVWISYGPLNLSMVKFSRLMRLHYTTTVWASVCYLASSVVTSSPLFTLLLSFFIGLPCTMKKNTESVIK